LLGIESVRTLERSPFLGPLFEGFVASEILKLQVARGRPRELYHFRDQQGLEVDLVVPAGDGKLDLIEVKAARGIGSAAALPVERLAKAVSRYRVRSFVVHRPPRSVARLTALRPGVRAVGVEGLLRALGGS
jgi:hypothetical protein